MHGRNELAGPSESVIIVYSETYERWFSTAVPRMTEFPHNVWAPWRFEYIEALRDDAGGDEPCFLCSYRDAPGDDGKNHVLFRRSHALAVLNRFPYTGGHLLIAPLAHKAGLADLSDDEARDLWGLTRDCQAVLDRAIGPHGYNIGINLGRCAGAGLPGHIHQHVVPRWNGDTNFMAVLGDVRVIPQALDRMYDQLRAAARALTL